jgi:hypothetical protein
MRYRCAMLSASEYRSFVFVYSFKLPIRRGVLGMFSDAARLQGTIAT